MELRREKDAEHEAVLRHEKSVERILNKDRQRSNEKDKNTTFNPFLTKDSPVKTRDIDVNPNK